MPLYEYTCPNCSNRFETLKSLEESLNPSHCPHCGDLATRVFSPFSYHNQKTYNEKFKEQSAEKMWKAERRLEEDKSLQVDNWLGQVKKEMEEKKAMAKQG